MRTTILSVAISLVATTLLSAQVLGSLITESTNMEACAERIAPYGSSRSVTRAALNETGYKIIEDKGNHIAFEEDGYTYVLLFKEGKYQSFAVQIKGGTFAQAIGVVKTLGSLGKLANTLEVKNEIGNKIYASTCDGVYKMVTASIDSENTITIVYGIVDLNGAKQ